MNVHLNRRRCSRRFFGWAGVWIILACALPANDAAPDTFAAIRNLPASNPYRSPLEAWLTLPEEQRKTLLSWSERREEGEPPAPPLTVEQTELLTGLTESLRAAARQPDAASWPATPNPAEPENPMAFTVPHVGVMMGLGRLVMRGSEGMPSAEAIETYAAVAQMGRQTRLGRTLIEQLAGVGLEGMAMTGAARRLGEFSAAELDVLSAAWGGLRAAPGIDQAISGERDQFFRPLLHRILKPGLAALLAESADEEGATPTAGTDVGTDLRLTAIISDGVRMIGLEDVAKGTSFFVPEGKTVNDVTLISIDFEVNRAQLRVGGKDAVMDLSSKRIVGNRAVADRLMRSMGGIGGEQLINTLLRRVRDHPGGLDGYIRQLESDYETAFSDALLRAEQPKLAAIPQRKRTDDPLLQIMMPTLDRVARTLNRADLTVTMLNAATSLRRGELTGQTMQPTPDPWARANGGKLNVERMPDGGFILRSIYEGRDGNPTEYKFAAPDAGMVRSPAHPQTSSTAKP